MTIHPIAVIATIAVLTVAATATWLTQRVLRRRKSESTSVSDFSRWNFLFLGYSVVLAAIALAILHASGLLPA